MAATDYFLEVGTSKNVQPIRKVLHKHFAARDAITPRPLKGFKCLFFRAFFYTEPVSH